MTDALQVTTTTDNRDAALELARSAVQARLAAGGDVSGPNTSFFWHDGEFGTGEEWRLRLHTTRECYEALEAHLLDRHPWSNPEISAVEVATGSAGCLEWIAKNATLGNS